MNSGGEGLKKRKISIQIVVIRIIYLSTRPTSFVESKWMIQSGE